MYKVHVSRRSVKNAKILSSLFLNHPLLGRPDWTLKSEIENVYTICFVAKKSGELLYHLQGRRNQPFGPTTVKSRVEARLISDMSRFVAPPNT